MEVRIATPSLELPHGDQLRFEEIPDGLGGTTHKLVHIPHNSDRRNGPIHDNTEWDTWEPDIIRASRIANLGMWQVPENQVGDVQGHVLQLTGESFLGDGHPDNWSGWNYANGGWDTSVVHMFPSSKRYTIDLAAPINALDPCGDWSIEVWGRMERDSIAPFPATAPKPLYQYASRFFMTIGNITFYLLLERTGHPLGHFPQTYYASGGARVRFPCGDVFVGYDPGIPIDADVVGTWKMLGIALSYDSATKTLDWAIGSDEDGVYRSGQYVDKWGFAGICPNTEIHAEGTNDGTDVDHRFTVRKIKITSSISNPVGSITFGV